MTESAGPLIFGIHAIEMALKAGEVKLVMMQQDSRNQRLLRLQQMIERDGVPCQRVSLKELDRMCAERHQGVVAHIQSVSLKTEKQLKAQLVKWQDPLLLVLDCIEDPRNLGACLRSANAAGVNAVIFSKDKAASITAVTHKTAAGAVEHLDLYQVTNLVRAIEAIKAAGIWVYGTALEDGSQSLYETDFSGPVALVMGNEGKGLRHLVKQSCDHLVHIPMQGDVQSLNVAVATGVALFEVVRQRQAKPA